MRNVAPRLLVRQTSHSGHDSNRLEEQRELLSELILRKQPHLHRQQEGIAEITGQNKDTIQHGQRWQNDQLNLRPLHQQNQELERDEQQRYDKEQ